MLEDKSSVYISHSLLFYNYEGNSRSQVFRSNALLLTLRSVCIKAIVKFSSVTSCHWRRRIVLIGTKLSFHVVTQLDESFLPVSVYLNGFGTERFFDHKTGFSSSNLSQNREKNKMSQPRESRDHRGTDTHRYKIPPKQYQITETTSGFQAQQRVKLVAYVTRRENHNVINLTFYTTSKEFLRKPVFQENRDKIKIIWTSTERSSEFTTNKCRLFRHNWTVHIIINMKTNLSLATN